jgi:phage-related protein
MKQNKIDSCELHNIKIFDSNENSITISMGPECEKCNYLNQCKKELMDQIMSNFIWINQINLI